MREKPEPSSTFMSIFLIKPCQTGGAGQPGTAAGDAGDAGDAGGLRSPLLPLLPSSRAVSPWRWGCASLWSSCRQSSAARLGASLEMRAQVAQALRRRGMLPWDITVASRPPPLTSTQLHLPMRLPASWHRRCRSSSPAGAEAPWCPQHPFLRACRRSPPCHVPVPRSFRAHMPGPPRRLPPASLATAPPQHSLPTTPSCAVPL